MFLVLFPVIYVMASEREFEKFSMLYSEILEGECDAFDGLLNYLKIATAYKHLVKKCFNIKSI